MTPSRHWLPFFALATVIFASFDSSAIAIDLATYSFDADASPTTTAAGVTAGNVLNNGISTFNIDVDTSNELRISDNNNDPSPSSYFEITLSANDASSAIDYTSMSWINDVNAGGRRAEYVVRSSVDGYLSDVATMAPNDETVNFDLSSIPAQNAVTLRIFPNKDQNLSYRVDVNDLALTGDLSAPESFSGSANLSFYTFDEDASADFFSFPGTVSTDVSTMGLSDVSIDGTTANQLHFETNNPNFDANEFIELGISTLESGDTVSLEELTFQSSSAGGRSAEYELRSSVDGFASIVDTDSGNGVLSFDLSSLVELADVTLRLFPRKSGSLEARPDLDNFQLIGTFNAAPAAIPEPTSIALWSLLGLVGVGFAWRQQRRSRRAGI